jgi:hypothetical protein
VFLGGQPQQQPPEQRRVLRSDSLAAHRSHHEYRRLIPPIYCSQIHHRERMALERGDKPAGPAGLRNDVSSKNLVTPYDLVEGVLERGHIEPASYAQRAGVRQRKGVRLELV